ncbi:unnamed protein product [Didymodactylos carnosus]|uniref:Uncharacterized protein n=1 Tax=Didymodactylos carnosus TaxID=1234261 RepID=A0A8S2S0C6_9BILA|nr:unnamed protein product [Didymodactylos carnosus]CAF4193959.1 unnamed protein product [Didymodactylos carnosus]
MNRFLQNNIKTEITEKAEYQIICLKQHLIQIYQKINELNQKHLNPEDYEFTIDFGTEIIEWLYQTILGKMTTDQEKLFKTMEKQVTEKITTMEHDFLERLEKSFGDIDNVNEMAIKVFNNMKNECLSTIEGEYKTLMKDGTHMKSK